MTGRIWFAPAGTAIEDTDEWPEVIAITDFQLAPDNEPDDDEPAFSWPTSQTFTMELELGAARAMWEMIEKARRDQLHLIAASREVAASVLQIHPLGGGPWSYQRTTTADYAEFARALGFDLHPWQIDVMEALRKQAGRGGP